MTLLEQKYSRNGDKVSLQQLLMMNQGESIGTQQRTSTHDALHLDQILHGFRPISDCCLFVWLFVCCSQLGLPRPARSARGAVCLPVRPECLPLMLPMPDCVCLLFACILGYALVSAQTAQMSTRHAVRTRDWSNSGPGLPEYLPHCYLFGVRCARVSARHARPCRIAVRLLLRGSPSLPEYLPRLPSRLPDCCFFVARSPHVRLCPLCPPVCPVRLPDRQREERRM